MITDLYRNRKMYMKIWLLVLFCPLLSSLRCWDTTVTTESLRDWEDSFYSGFTPSTAINARRRQGVTQIEGFKRQFLIYESEQKAKQQRRNKMSDNSWRMYSQNWRLDGRRKGRCALNFFWWYPPLVFHWLWSAVVSSGVRDFEGERKDVMSLWFLTVQWP